MPTDLFAGQTPAANVISSTMDLSSGVDSAVALSVRGTFTLTLEPQIRLRGDTSSTAWLVAAMEDIGSATDAETSAITVPGSFIGAYPGFEFRLKITAFTSNTSMQCLANYQ